MPPLPLGVVVALQLTQNALVERVTTFILKKGERGRPGARSCMLYCTG